MRSAIKTITISNALIFVMRVSAVELIKLKCKTAFSHILKFSLTLCFATGMLQCQKPTMTTALEKDTPNGIADFNNSSPIFIGPGDLIDVKVFETPELSSQLRVDEHGEITLPAGGVLRVTGTTARQVAEAIENVLRSDSIMLNPHVLVFLVQSATEGITILGEVKAPGIYSLLGRHSLYDALAAAGGPTQNQGAEITITHKGDSNHPEVVQVHSPDYAATQDVVQIYPGDTVLVSKASIIYLMGDITRAGAYYIQTGGPINVLNSIAMAGGLLRTASTKSAMIIRKSNGRTDLLAVNLNDILKLKQPDIVLEAGDILYIPSSEWKRFLQSFGPSAAQAVANAAAISVIAN